MESGFWSPLPLGERVRVRGLTRVAMFASLCLATAADAVDLEARWRQACQNRSAEELPTEVEAPNLGEPGRAEQLFEQTLNVSATSTLQDLETLRQAWRTLGMDLVPAEAGGELFLILEEAAGSRHGRGFYVFRPASRKPLALQAPHAVGDDRDTAEITFALLRHSGAVVAAWSTAPRRDNNLTGEPDTLFQRLTEVFARRQPEARILQLHGFSRSKRKSAAGKKADVILSNGTRQPPPHLDAFADCLSHRLGLRTAVYPTQVRELGATKNAQAIALAAAGHAGFIHFEMARSLRRRLTTDATDRAALLTCIDTTFNPENR